MIRKIILLSFLLGFSFCNKEKKNITIVGEAFDAKRSAVVISNEGIFYLDELVSWDKKYYGKKVKVTGKLKIEKNEKRESDTVEMQRIVGEIKIILNAKWDLVE
ncbi:MAG: hypothetical protein ABL872_11205 [Lacibacter sp.]